MCILKHNNSSASSQHVLMQLCFTVCETPGLGWCCPRRRCGPLSERAHMPIHSSAMSRACPDTKTKHKRSVTVSQETIIRRMIIIFIIIIRIIKSLTQLQTSVIPRKLGCFFFKLCPIHGKSTHPVDICIALWNDVGVKEGGFTRCGEREEGTRSESRGRKGRSEIRDTPSAFLTCRETHGNNDFCLVGGERGRRRVVK